MVRKVPKLALWPERLSRKDDTKLWLKVVSATFSLVFYKSKREHLWNLEKCLFYFKNSFPFRESQILVF